MDHDWGPKFDIFLSEADFQSYHFKIDEILKQELPPEICGFSTNFAKHEDNTTWLQKSEGKPINHGIAVTTVSAFFQDYLGLNPLQPIEELDWLSLPPQKVRTIFSYRGFISIMPNSPDTFFEEAKPAFEMVIRHLTSTKCQTLNYNLKYPKHQFLHYLVDQKGMFLHGSNCKTLEVLTPQKATGVVAGQAETAVYATVDTLMAIFFAIIDRSKVSFFATRNDPPRFFIAKSALSQSPWGEGMVYIFGPNSFESTAGGHPVCFKAVSPIGKLLVKPHDFPFLNQVQPIDSLDEVPGR